MNLRTDLALESAESGDFDREGIEFFEEKSEDATLTRLKIKDRAAAKRLGKPIGDYVTVEVKRFTADAGLDRGAVFLLGREISKLLPKNASSVLVAGLGNSDITPDALGPRAAEKIIATRHISKELAASLGLPRLRAVSVLAPGVLGQTGIETGEIILATAEKINPSAVIVIDALAARSLSRLGTTVQITNAGITPGSGVGNARSEISEKTLRVPVIAVGVPTVVDMQTLFCDVGAKVSGDLPDMIVTPKEVDLMIDRAAELIAVSINKALQPELSLDDILGLI